MAISRDEWEAQTKLYGRLVARAWSDEVFKQRFLAEPAVVLKEAGIMVPEGVTVRAHETTDTTFHLVLPPRPAELNDEQLEQEVAGYGCAGSAVLRSASVGERPLPKSYGLCATCCASSGCY